MDLYQLILYFVCIGMDSTTPEGAPKNPFHDYVEAYANLDRDHHPNEYQRFGAYTWVEIPEEIKTGITDSVTKIQTMLLPTLKGFSNERNISQLQDKVYRKLLVYENQFNNCQIAARNTVDAYNCGNMLISRLNDQMPKHIKKILDDY